MSIGHLIPCYLQCYPCPTLVWPVESFLFLGLIERLCHHLFLLGYECLLPFWWCIICCYSCSPGRLVSGVRSGLRCPRVQGFRSSGELEFWGSVVLEFLIYILHSVSDVSFLVMSRTVVVYRFPCFLFSLPGCLWTVSGLSLDCLWTVSGLSLWLWSV